MLRIAPSEKDDDDALEKRLWAAPDMKQPHTEVARHDGDRTAA